jgi:hypothetical protein
MNLQRMSDGGDPLQPHLLTTHQRRIVEAIERYEDATGEPCPAAWLGRRFSLHHSTIQRHLFLLHRKGWLKGPNAPARLADRKK